MAEYARSYEPESYGSAVPQQPEREAQVKRGKVVQLQEKELRRSRRQNAHSFRMLLDLAMVLTIVVAIGAVVFSQVRLTELTDEIHTASQTLNQEQNLAVQLEMQAAAQMNTEKIEEYARNVLGMEKASEGQISYINLQQGDVGTVVEEAKSGGVFGQIWSFLTSIFS